MASKCRIYTVQYYTRMVKSKSPFALLCQGTFTTSTCSHVTTFRSIAFVLPFIAKLICIRFGPETSALAPPRWSYHGRDARLVSSSSSSQRLENWHSRYSARSFPPPSFPGVERSAISLTWRRAITAATRRGLAPRQRLRETPPGDDAFESTVTPFRDGSS